MIHYHSICQLSMNLWPCNRSSLVFFSSFSFLQLFALLFSFLQSVKLNLHRSLKSSCAEGPKMCTVTYFHNKTCLHTWAIITNGCGPLMGFSTCPSFVCGAGATKERPRFYNTVTRACPRCNEALGIPYDRNLIRVVESMGWGLKIGAGPDEDDWGVDLRGTGCRCVVL